MKIRVLLTVISLFYLASCNELEFLKEDPKSTLTAGGLYTSQSGFETALNSLYNKFRQLERSAGLASEQETMMGWATAVSTDYFYNPVTFNGSLPWTEWGQYSNSSLSCFRIWFNYLYETVLYANAIINRAETPGVSWDSDNRKNEIVAEARLIRGWSYRHLTFLWGDVPLVLNEITGSNFRNDWERTPKSQIYEAMEEDWLFAESHLPSVPTTAGGTSSATAQHYLAELYLVKNQPEEAEKKAQAAIDNPNFKLITERYGVKANEPGVPFMDQFYEGNVLHAEGNTEVLWALPFSRTVQGGGHNRMRRGWMIRYYSLPGLVLTEEGGGRGAGWFGMNKHGFDLYEAGDDRVSEYAIHWQVPKGDGTYIETTTDPDKYFGREQIGTFPPTAPVWVYNWPSTRKWDDVFLGDLSLGEGYKDQPYIRLAETYLLLAEAQHRQGKNDLAAQNINTVRNRSNASSITAADVSIDFILDERARELFAEEHRRYTLLRLGLWFERTKKYNAQSGPNITERDTLYPIPRAVIDANIDREFPQNPGW